MPMPKCHGLIISSTQKPMLMHIIHANPALGCTTGQIMAGTFHKGPVLLHPPCEVKQNSSLPVFPALPMALTLQSSTKGTTHINNSMSWSVLPTLPTALANPPSTEGANLFIIHTFIHVNHSHKSNAHMPCI